MSVLLRNFNYHWIDGEFAPVARFTKSLIKLVPTSWGPPTFQIDGIKMLPTAHTCPYADAERKVGLINPRGKIISLGTPAWIVGFRDHLLNALAVHLINVFV